MARPQQPDVARSGHGALEPDAPPPDRPGPPSPASRPGGPVPEANRPGHHPAHEQDQPDLDELAERLGVQTPDAPPPGPPLRTLALVGAGAAVAVGLAVTATRLLRRRGTDVAALVGDLAERTPLPLRRPGADGPLDRVGDLVGGLADRAA